MTGTIVRLITDKGFGFVKDTKGNEYFFHRSAIVNGEYNFLEEGQQITFDATNGPKGPRAENVTVV